MSCSRDGIYAKEAKVDATFAGSAADGDTGDTIDTTPVEAVGVFCEYTGFNQTDTAIVGFEESDNGTDWNDAAQRHVLPQANDSIIADTVGGAELNADSPAAGSIKASYVGDKVFARPKLTLTGSAAVTISTAVIVASRPLLSQKSPNVQA